MDKTKYVFGRDIHKARAMAAEFGLNPFDHRNVKLITPASLDNLRGNRISEEQVIGDYSRTLAGM